MNYVVASVEINRKIYQYCALVGPSNVQKILKSALFEHIKQCLHMDSFSFNLLVYNYWNNVSFAVVPLQ